ncbi:hypothetical protein NP233_g1042 [Leucocoprinus birnbaumii]|uniref:Cytochrome P450 n=1 Tax=Leucocoprinus birnbaumii TaxID=56174 RepID=A0AAD5YV83_9AGAR|nr:hypothetical protein NP233_g1042 [Leucocoprinus birnbaumii]
MVITRSVIDLKTAKSGKVISNATAMVQSEIVGGPELALHVSNSFFSPASRLADPDRFFWQHDPYPGNVNVKIATASFERGIDSLGKTGKNFLAVERDRERMEYSLWATCDFFRSAKDIPNPFGKKAVVNLIGSGYSGAADFHHNFLASAYLLLLPPVLSFDILFFLSMTGLSYLDYTLLGAGVYLLNSYLKQQRLPAPLPPGPRGLPIIGNAADMPTQKDWLTYAEWGRKYGGIASVNVMGQPIIIVNSADVMQELDKKGALYSDRPRLEMGGELVGYSDTLVLIPYGERFRVYRKNIAKYIGGTAQVKELHPLIESSTRKFLQRTLHNPEDLMAHLRKLQGNIILKLTYGIDVQDGEDPFVALIERANDNFNKASIPGSFLVDFFPVLRTLPEWLPGMGFMETARRWAGDTLEMVEAPYKFTLKQMVSALPRFLHQAHQTLMFF